MTRRVVTFDLFGWGEIANHLGVSERTAKEYGYNDGLPYYTFKGRVRARSTEVSAWLLSMTRTGPHDNA